MTAPRVVVVGGAVVAAVLLGWWASRPVPSPKAPSPPPAAPGPRGAPVPVAPPVPTPPPVPHYLPPSAPPATVDVSDLLPGKEAHELEAADTGIVVNAAKMRAAQLHLLPPPDVPLRPLDPDTVDDTLAELAPKMARCLGPGAEGTAPTVELLLGPILDGTKNLLQVTELPEGHPEPSTLACLTEVIRSTPFEHGPPSTYTVALEP